MKNLYKLNAMRSIAGIIALIAVIGFTMTACKDEPEPDPDTVPSAWQGTWVGTGGAAGTYTFTGTTLKWVDGGDSCTVGSLVFTAKTNTGTNSATYPNGYTITGKVTAVTGEEYSVGENFSSERFINTSGNRIATANGGNTAYWQKQ